MLIYVRLLYSRKIKRCIVFSAVIIALSIIISVLIFFDLSCVSDSSQSQSNLQLRKINSFNKSESTASYPKWTTIVDSAISLYSAFYYRNNITVIAIINQDIIDFKFFCHISTKNFYLETDAIIEILPESYSDFYIFVSVKIICQNVNFFNSSKVKVLLKINKNILETSSVPIVPLEQNQTELKTRSKKQINEIVVCVRPLFGPFASLSSILEFIAYYRANGIQKIIFYELSIASKIKQLLHSMPFIQLLSFDLPIDSYDIHAEGQIAAINDCLLRSSSNTVILVDIDEFIVTKNYPDIKTYVNYKIQNESVGALVVPNVMFCNQYIINRNVNRFPRILYSTARQTSKWKHGNRSKMIILKPLSVVELGIHTVWLWNDSNITSENVDESDAMLFHYRSCCQVWQPFYHNSYIGITFYFLTNNDNIIYDKSVHRFKTEIVSFLRRYVNF